MNLYEHLFILDPNLEDKTKEEQISKIEGLITENGGTVLKTKNLGARKLSYTVKKHDKGEYILLLFNSPSESISKLERYCRLSEPILKYLIIKIEKKKHIASVMASLNAELSSAEAKPEDASKTAPVTSPAISEEKKEDV
ncbi:MAG: 30S ribosomal protein S6 [Nitrospirae bacterium]|nr:30S ribosomal protein S6 [Nitrospirota bacterium]